MDNNLWRKCVEFHGHECPGLATGYRVCEALKIKFPVEFSKDEEIVCIAENDSCAVDAVQVVTGCTVGKGNLLFRGTGKMAFAFFVRRTGESIRIVAKPRKKKFENKRESQEYVLNADIDELFEFKKPEYQLPEKARIFKTYFCEVCGEGAPEHKIRLMDGKKVCLDCFKDYSREM